MPMRIGGNNRYSDIVINDRIIYLSGVVPSCDGTLYEQTKEVLDIIDKSLTCAGSSKNDILTMTIYLTDITKYEEMNRAFDEWIPAKSGPARATIGASLPNPLWKIEVVVSAAVSQQNYPLNYIV